MSYAQDNGLYTPTTVSLLDKGGGKYRIALTASSKEKLGSGHGGDVYRVPGYTIDTQNKWLKERPHVIKVLKKRDNLEAYIKHELQGHQLFGYLRTEYKKKYFEKLSGIAEAARLHQLQNGDICFVMKEYRGKDLHHRLVRTSSSLPNLDFTAKLFLGPMKALAYFAEMGVVYFDGKALNTFINGKQMAIGDPSGSFILPELSPNETYCTLLEKIDLDKLKFPDFTAKYITESEYKTYKEHLNALYTTLSALKKGTPAVLHKPLPPYMTGSYNTLRSRGESIQVMQMGMMILSAYLKTDEVWVSSSHFFSYEEVEANKKTRTYLVRAKKELIERVFTEKRFVRDFGTDRATRLGNLIARMTSSASSRIGAKEANITYRSIVLNDPL